MSTDRLAPSFSKSIASSACLGLLVLSLAIPAGAQEAREPKPVDTESLARMVEEKSAEKARRAEVEARALALGLPILKELPDGTIFGLDSFDGDRPIYLITDNTNAADTVSTDELWAGGSLGLALDGSGEVLGEWDGGSARLTHQEFGGRATSHDGAGTSNHATHVAGTMIGSGVDARAHGMAPAATLRSFDFFDDELEMAAEQMGANATKVSNHSYGFITGWRFNFQGDGLWVWFGDVQISTTEDPLFGLYSQTAADWDQIAVDSPYYLMVKSAGNDRGEGITASTDHWHFDSNVGDFVMATDSHPVDGGATGYDTIGGGPGSAKNILTVGAVSDIIGGWTDPSDVVMSSFSGWGPTDDGRIKPDLVANGVSLFSSGSQADAGYAVLSGTSMSTPNTSGSMGLLHQHADNLFGSYFLAATMKALALHTTDEAGNTGPDYTFGWGLLNTAAAADVMTAHSTTNDYFFHMAEETLSDAATFETPVLSDGTGPLVATLVWTDPAGTPPATAVDPSTPMLVNDLDLRLIGPDSTAHEPWILDPVNPANAATTGDNTLDNVEQVVIEMPEAGNYTLQVTHKGVLAAPQDFSLVITGNGDPSFFADGFESGNTSAWSSSSP